MDAENIKDVLEAYLRAKIKDIRIFREKKIGSAICDMMAVTSTLDGFEIKSDLDNYERLERQVKAYDSFFDKNYIVVGRSHLKGVEKKIPSYWGILCIDEESVCVERTAKLNKNVSRRHQLSALWKIELKNILTQNNLPTYALQSKNFIVDKIFERVDSNKLHSQIVAELKGRDYSLIDEIDDDCPIELLDIISEQEFSSFTLDKWIELYQKAKRVCEKKEVVFEREKGSRPPHEIDYTKIEVALGVPWVSVDIVRDFIWELLEFDKCIEPFKLHLENNPNFVIYEKITGNWHIENKTWYGCGTLGEHTYGIPRYNALHIIEATLNLREIKICDGTKYNEGDTLAALEKQALIIKKFSEWVWQDEDRRWEIEQAYNDLFGELGEKIFDGTKLNFPEMATDITLRDYQKNAVQKIISMPNTLLAFDVGAGKTYIMAAAAMLMRQRGLSLKNLFVVPNNIVGQWEKMFSTLYPKAKLLTIDPKSFAPPVRKKVLDQMKCGDYDGIIIAYSCFEMIPLSHEYLSTSMEQRLDELRNEIRSLKYWQWGRTAIEREISYITSLISQFIKSGKDGCGVYFEELGVNTLFLDEAHNYKNIPLRTALKNLRGINVNGSDKCLDMLEKVRCVQNQNGGRGVVFATGTPLCNSISDAYTMQTYLFHDELKKRQLDRFDNWVKTFARPEQVCEIDVDTSKFRFVHRFTRFFNLSELSKLFGEMTAFYSNEASELPTCAEYTQTIMSTSEVLKKYMHSLCDRAEAIRAKKVDKKEDNMLKITTDGRKAALDLTLVGEKQPYDGTSKVYRCVENVGRIYNEYAGCSQLVFCDYSTPKGEDFSVYRELKSRLVLLGINEKEIAFVHSCVNEESKLRLYEKVNKGEVRVLIGSTFKLGIGANVQTKLKAIHHLDVPWRPADMVQRDGRILRRGNENNDVFIFRYITEGSFDAYSWQILETKQQFISQFLAGTANTRTMSDLENNVLSYGEVKALALSDPRMKMLAEKENELRSVRILSLRENELKLQMKAENARLKEEIESLEDNIKRSKQNVEFIKNIEIDPMQLKAVTAQIPQKLSGVLPNTKLFTLYEFDFFTPLKQSEKQPFIKAVRNGVEYFMDTSESISGNATRLKNFFAKIQSFTQSMQNALDNAKNKLASNNEAIGVKGQYTERLAVLQKERNEILTQIKVDD